MIVFDAGVLIAHLDDKDLFRPIAAAFMEEFEEFEFAAAATTIAETLVHPAAGGGVDRAVAAFESLMLVSLDITGADAAGIARTRATTRLRLPDAIVLHLAARHGGELVTTDRGLARAAESSGVTAHLLELTEAVAR